MTLGLLTRYFTGQARLYGRVLVVFFMKYFNLLRGNVFMRILNQHLLRTVQMQISMFTLFYPWTIKFLCLMLYYDSVYTPEKAHLHATPSLRSFS